MAEVSVTVNGRPYQIACDDGEERHVLDLARYVNSKVDELAGAVGQVGEARLLLMAAILMADELAEAYETVDRLQAGGASAQGERTSVAEITVLAQRLEAIAERLENT